MSVMGVPGSGKSTLAAELAVRLGVPHIELDALFHQQDWQPTPEPEFRERVAAAVSGDGWVVDGNYSTVRDLIWWRADTVIWFDLPRRQVMEQIVRRTVRRAARRVELWTGAGCRRLLPTPGGAGCGSSDSPPTSRPANCSTSSIADRHRDARQASWSTVSVVVGSQAS
ncbi:hypothetical protein EDC02_8015 [Micromonospora sp. Llam0]|nr:hypothetical protein EDC02_8015 [Micromonospora sp. Llam0]